MEPILSVRELTKTFSRPGQGKQTAVNGVSFDLRPGERLGIIGESGSGKTTVANLITRLLDADGGRILLDGEEIGRMDPDRYRRERVSVIFQSFQLFPLLTVLENVCVPRELQGRGRRDAEETARALLREVGIPPEEEGRFPAQLSGGEQQRAAIARALSGGARLLLADEPTGNLDGENSRGIVALLRKLAGDGCCVVVVTHDMAIAAEADRVYEMRDGRLSLRSGE